MRKIILVFLAVVVVVGSIYFFKKSFQEGKSDVLTTSSFDEEQSTEVYGKYYSKAENFIEDISLE